MLQELAVDSEVIVASHPEIVRKLYAWRTCFRVLRRLALMTDELDIQWDSGSAPSLEGMMRLYLLFVSSSSYHLL